MASYDLNEMIFFGKLDAGEVKCESIPMGTHPKGTFLSFSRDRLGVIVQGDWYLQIKLNSMLEEIADSY